MLSESIRTRPYFTPTETRSPDRAGLRCGVPVAGVHPVRLLPASRGDEARSQQTACEPHRVRVSFPGRKRSTHSAKLRGRNAVASGKPRRKSEPGRPAPGVKGTGKRPNAGRSSFRTRIQLVFIFIYREQFLQYCFQVTRACRGPFRLPLAYHLA